MRRLLLCLTTLSACAGAPSGESGAPDGAAGGDTGPTETSPGVTVGQPATCASPQAAPSWVEQGEAWNLLTPLMPEERYGHQDGAGLAAADIDQDGQIDLLLTRMPGTNRTMFRRGDTFEEQTIPMPSGNGALWIDVDGDADIDLLLGGPMAFMLRNQGGNNFQFEPFPTLDGDGVTSASIVHDLSAGDFDGDGRLEVFLARTADIHDELSWHNDRMLHLEADGLVVEADAVPEDVGLRHGYDALTFDADDDGDLDVYLSNDLGMNFGWSTLLRNDDGALVDAADDCLCSLPTAAKGADVADFNGDGLPDLYVSGSPHNVLLTRQQGGAWVDVTATAQASQLMDQATGWGGVFLDLDNDGQRDLISAQGDRWNEIDADKAFDAPLVLLRQDDGVFTDVAAAHGLTAEGSFRAVVVLDFNDDGVEDILVSQAADRPLFYVSQGCTAANWIEVDAPVGAKVEVIAGGGVQTDWVTLDSGFIGTTLPRVHLGLGDTDVVDGIVVTLPGGDRLTAAGPIDARTRVSFAR